MAAVDDSVFSGLVPASEMPDRNKMEYTSGDPGNWWRTYLGMHKKRHFMSIAHATNAASSWRTCAVLQQHLDFCIEKDIRSIIRPHQGLRNLVVRHE